LEWAPYNILVNAVAPGIINTDRSCEGSTAIPSIPKARIAEIPLKRAAELAEILPLVLYFATEASSYTTGQVMLIDGGCSAQ
jgi:NAD(P)-dependent dehydrogenase (short-subunit alcohol dehydrogenase family)